jgi:hypothetical protein
MMTTLSAHLDQFVTVLDELAMLREITDGAPAFIDGARHAGHPAPTLKRKMPVATLRRKYGCSKTGANRGAKQNPTCRFAGEKSETGAASKTVKGLWVLRGFESHPLRFVVGSQCRNIEL